MTNRSAGKLASPAVALAVAGALAMSGCGGAGAKAATSTTTVVATKAAHHNGGAAKGRPATAADVTFAGPDGVEARWVIAENKKKGTQDWHLTGDSTGAPINGFANVVAARRGQKVTLYITTSASSYHISAYRIGYYGGDGGRLVWRSPDLKGVVQPQCPLTASTRMISCDNWAPSISLTIGPQFVQGDYLFKLVADPGQQSYIP